MALAVPRAGLPPKPAMGSPDLVLLLGSEIKRSCNLGAHGEPERSSAAHLQQFALGLGVEEL